MKKLLLRDWNLMRGLRMFFGVLAVGAGGLKGDVLVAGIGSLLVVQAVMNWGCGACATRTPGTCDAIETTYEEVKK